MIQRIHQDTHSRQEQPWTGQLYIMHLEISKEEGVVSERERAMEEGMSELRRRDDS